MEEEISKANIDYGNGESQTVVEKIQMPEKEKELQELQQYSYKDYKIALEFLLNIGGRTMM